MITVPAFSQFKQSDVVASAGGFEVKDGYSVSYTIGEPVAGTLKAGDLIVVQGFPQAKIIDCITITHPISDYSIRINLVFLSGYIRDADIVDSIDYHRLDGNILNFKFFFHCHL